MTGSTRAENGLEGTVVEATFLGRTQEAVIRAMGLELRTVQLRTTTLIEGQRV